MTIADKITRLQNARTAIATAITNKGGTVSSGDGFEDFATDIGTIATQKEEQTKSMALGAAAPSAVTPDSGKVLSSVSPSIDTSVIKAENIKSGTSILGVNGTLEPSASLHFEKNNPSSISGSGNYFTIVSGNARLAEIRNEPNLMVRVETIGFQSGTSCVACVNAYNSRNYSAWDDAVTAKYQLVRRFNSSQSLAWNSNVYAINDGSSLSDGSGRVHITSSGDLRIYGNTSSYAIPSGTIKADVYML